ncbi:MAG: hypothetical protein KF827_15685 [Ferrovibrio sp.]|nr:hypothetical protein [Ferrovibrio sp.]
MYSEHNAKRARNCKIVATLGPASSRPDQIKALVEAGADVFRLNFSHGSHDDHRQRIHTVRALERELNRPIGLLACGVGVASRDICYFLNAGTSLTWRTSQDQAA